jgi:hypothetical protein
MSPKGQTQKSGCSTGRSALPSITDIVSQAWQVRKGPIVLKNSKIAKLRKSRQCSALALSAAARLSRTDTRASDRFSAH